MEHLKSAGILTIIGLSLYGMISIIDKDYMENLKEDISTISIIDEMELSDLYPSSTFIMIKDDVAQIDVAKCDLKDQSLLLLSNGSAEISFIQDSPIAFAKCAYHLKESDVLTSIAEQTSFSTYSTEFLGQLVHQDFVYDRYRWAAHDQVLFSPASLIQTIEYNNSEYHFTCDPVSYKYDLVKLRSFGKNSVLGDEFPHKLSDFGKVLSPLIVECSRLHDLYKDELA